MKALLAVLLVFAMVSMKGFRGAEAGTEANPSCCFPPAFMSSYEYFTNNSGFQSTLYYSANYGVRFDGQLWDPLATASRFRMYLLKAGHFFTYNVTTGECTHFHCESCFEPFCGGHGDQEFKYAGNVTIGVQKADKYAFSLGLTFYNEITVMNIRPGQCIPVNELVMSGMYEETETDYANSFFYNLVPAGSLNPNLFVPPSSCRPGMSSTSLATDPILSPRSLPASFLSHEAQHKFRR